MNAPTLNAGRQQNQGTFGKAPSESPSNNFTTQKRSHQSQFIKANSIQGPAATNNQPANQTGPSSKMSPALAKAMGGSIAKNHTKTKQPISSMHTSNAAP